MSDPRIVFLPGASGDPEFWAPVAELLPVGWDTVRLGWPGLGDQAPDPAVRGFDDLVALVAARLARRTDLVAQSMGGIVALRVAAHHPDKVRRLVLAATSGGFDVASHGAEDWREQYRSDYPHAARWITEPVPDENDTIARVTAPTLLLWGGADRISPTGAGEHLAAALPAATLRIIPDADHGFAHDRPEPVAGLIAAHLSEHLAEHLSDTETA
jgi:pimeloyl-ACP methyl ester carboxylesterase